MSDAVDVRTDSAADRNAGAIRVVVGRRKELATIALGHGEAPEQENEDDQVVDEVEDAPNVPGVAAPEAATPRP